VGKLVISYTRNDNKWIYINILNMNLTEYKPRIDIKVNKLNYFIEKKNINFLV
jgi:hypothetical protein